MRSSKHRRFISSLPCVVCTTPNRTQAAHVRMGNICGVGMKPSDDCCVPLCVECHAKQHNDGEIYFWLPYGGHENATRLAKTLYDKTEQRIKCLQALIDFRERKKDMGAYA